jgi:hypothetical protein
MWYVVCGMEKKREVEGRGLREREWRKEEEEIDVTG